MNMILNRAIVIKKNRSLGINNGAMAIRPYNAAAISLLGSGML
ncbi:hypothetical protein [Hydrocoleum sp. CS-953]|nr:hypothetical protein [Hydrocoleum sp. CS-953]